MINFKHIVNVFIIIISICAAQYGELVSRIESDHKYLLSPDGHGILLDQAKENNGQRSNPTYWWWIHSSDGTNPYPPNEYVFKHTHDDHWERFTIIRTADDVHDKLSIKPIRIIRAPEAGPQTFEIVPQDATTHPERKSTHTEAMEILPYFEIGGTYGQNFLHGKQIAFETGFRAIQYTSFNYVISRELLILQSKGDDFYWDMLRPLSAFKYILKHIHGLLFWRYWIIIPKHLETFSGTMHLAEGKVIKELVLIAIDGTNPSHLLHNNNDREGAIFFLQYTNVGLLHGSIPIFWIIDSSQCLAERFEGLRLDFGELQTIQFHGRHVATEEQTGTDPKFGDLVFTNNNLYHKSSGNWLILEAVIGETGDKFASPLFHGRIFEHVAGNKFKYNDGTEKEIIFDGTIDYVLRIGYVGNEENNIRLYFEPQCEARCVLHSSNHLKQYKRWTTKDFTLIQKSLGQGCKSCQDNSLIYAQLGHTERGDPERNAETIRHDREAPGPWAECVAITAFEEDGYTTHLHHFGYKTAARTDPGVPPCGSWDNFMRNVAWGLHGAYPYPMDKGYIFVVRTSHSAHAIAIKYIAGSGWVNFDSALFPQLIKPETTTQTHLGQTIVPGSNEAFYYYLHDAAVKTGVDRVVDPSLILVYRYADKTTWIETRKAELEMPRHPVANPEYYNMYINEKYDNEISSVQGSYDYGYNNNYNTILSNNTLIIGLIIMFLILCFCCIVCNGIIATGCYILGRTKIEPQKLENYQYGV